MAEKISFEQALDKLEGYAQALSSPDVSLDQRASKFMARASS